WIKFERLECRRPRLRESLVGREEINITEFRVRIGHACVCGSVVGVQSDCLFEVLNRLLEVILSILTPMVSALQERLVCFATLGISLCHSFLLLACEPPKLVGDVVCNFFLYTERICDFAIVLLSPKLFVLACVHGCGAYPSLLDVL